MSASNHKPAPPARLETGHPALTVSIVKNAIDQHPTSAEAGAVIAEMADGTFTEAIQNIRTRYQAALGETQDHAKAKKAVDALKKRLPGVQWSGEFSKRGDKNLVSYSGLLCADLDGLFDHSIDEALTALKRDPHCLTAFVSPTGTGVKAVFRVTQDAANHSRNFETVKHHVKETLNLDVDEACKNVERLCFVSDGVAHTNLNGASRPSSAVRPQSRQHIAQKLVGEIAWENDLMGYATCPGQHLHTTGAGEQDFKVMLDRVPTVTCFHQSCAGVLAGINHELRSQIAKAEFVPVVNSNRAGITSEYLGEDKGEISNPLPAIVDAAEFVAVPQEQPRELIQGLLHQGSKLVLGGGSKSFKTWTLLDLALSVAHGLPWLGRETIAGKVLYLNFEIQDYAWQKRIQAVAHAKRIELMPGAIKLWNLRGHAADFRTLLPLVIEETKQSGFALTILDPVYKLYGRTDENKAGDVAALLNGMESLAVETKAAVAFGAHFSKGNQAGKEAIDRISGSGVFARDPDSILIFTKHEEEDAFTVDTILRNFKPVDPFAVRWSFPLFRLAGELDPSKLKQVAGRKPDYVPDDLFKLLPPQGLTNKKWLAVAEKQGIKERTFYRLKKALETAGRVLDSKVSGHLMPITPNGASH